jgi:hypothetical protein
VALLNGGSLEAAREMANHSDPRTTKLYDWCKDLATFSGWAEDCIRVSRIPDARPDGTRKKASVL